LGPEHEFSLVDERLNVLPITDKVIKDYVGKIVNSVRLSNYTFSKELQAHVLEIKANSPFASPLLFEETMQNAVDILGAFLEKNYRAFLLGTGMHPLMRLEETRVWPHRHRKIYSEYDRLFGIKQHGWLNIQSYHLNLSYSDEKTAILLHNRLSELCAYLPAISSSSPFFEGKLGHYMDNRLHFYKSNQRRIPSITGDIVPEYASSFSQYRNEVIRRYSNDLEKAGAGKDLLFKEWVNSRGVIFRFDRQAIELRVFDEQECIKSDVALSCFVRAVLRGMVASNSALIPHRILIRDLASVIRCGMNAPVGHPHGLTAREVCCYLFDLALENAEEEEKKYLWIIRKRIEQGSLSEIIRRRVMDKAQRVDLKEAITGVYLTLISCLAKNQPYF
jgi:hypothetical protein